MKRNGRYVAMVSAALAAWLAGAPFGSGWTGSAAPGAEANPALVRMVIDPAPAPREALRYQLLPTLLDRKPGNAAVLYNKAGIMFSERDYEEDEEAWEAWDRIDKWSKTPASDLPRDEMQQELNRFRSVLREVDRAARREVCDWQLPLGEEDYIAMLLPDVQRTRSYGRLLALKARLEIAEGKFDEAVRTLQTGYGLARHVSRGPTLIHGVIAVVICRMMNAQVQELVQQPGAPNLYWALASLPRPLLDTRAGPEAETHQLYLTFPELREVDTADRSPEHWRELFERVAEWTACLGETLDLQSQALLIVAGTRGYPMAKRHLIAWGYPPEEVEAMPVARVLLLYTVHTYQEFRDDGFKWFHAPYWEARKGFEAAGERLAREGRRREVLPIATVLLPAVEHVSFLYAQNERAIAALRIVEAMRIYAADHGAELPAKLGDVSEVPIPIDPVTGQPFVYRVKGDTAVLEGPPPPGRPERDGIYYEIKLRR